MIPARIKRNTGRHALVDGIPYEMPVKGNKSPVLMAVYSIDADKAAALLPGKELHPVRLWNRKRSLLIVTVIDYRDTSIGKYIEFSLALACTHGPRPAPRLRPAHGGLSQRPRLQATGGMQGSPLRPGRTTPRRTQRQTPPSRSTRPTDASSWVSSWG